MYINRQSVTMNMAYAGNMTALALLVSGLFYSAPTLADDTALDSMVIAKNVKFDSAFLNVANIEGADLARFANGSNASPGVYNVAIYINNTELMNSDVEFKEREDKTVYPCLNQKIVSNINFNHESVPKSLLAALLGGEQCIDIESLVTGSQVAFDSNEQRLDIGIPQIYMDIQARGSVNPALWDKGVPAATLGYSMNGYTSQSHGRSNNSFYTGINSGLNIGAWYLRHNGSYTWMENGPSKYNTLNTYLQRDIPVIKGRILAGESNTSGQIFSTLPFSGIRLASDDRMLPASLRGYAPNIRGIARTSARVTVSQGGQTIYETTVSPGEFLINDLYPTGYGGNLDVTVHEADGTQQHFSVPYSSVAQLLRPGSHRYDFTVGKLRSDFIADSPDLFQMIYQRGLNNTITGYGGVQANQDYYALQLGAAVGTPIGAVAADVTQSKTKLPQSAGGDQSGQSYQLSYSKIFSETNSNLTLAGYRFSTSGYMDYMTAMQTRNALTEGYDPNSIGRAKNRLTLTASQGLPEGWGQVYASGSLQNYWNKEGSDQQFQVGYNNHYKNLSYGVSVNRSQSGKGTNQNNYLLSFSIPLGGADNMHTPQLRTDLNRDSNGNMRQQATISGSAGETNQFNYSASAMNGSNGAGTSGTLSGQYRSPSTSMSGSYSNGKQYQSGSVGMSGTIVAHPGGVTMTPYNSETIAVVEAKGAQGAAVSSYPGIKVDSRGYAVVPYLNPYQMNEISVDPKDADSTLELESTTQKVAPYSGAVVMLKYGSKPGWPVLINTTLDGAPVPFGADVVDSKGNTVGAVGQAGQIYARVNDEKGRLKVKWGTDTQQQCSVGYVLAPQPKGRKQADIQQFTTPCQKS